ncbi:DoxX family protein [Comamonadaceae bacterium G21597-S1]|nr:DoxX family protein [Comamonadaceae bacterium G21597-S1]
MQPSQQFFDTWTPRALAVLRIVTAFLFLQHGSAKLLHVPHVAMFDSLPVWSFIGFAGMLELVGGLMLIAGFFTRAVAFILSGQMAVAYFIGHAPKGNVLVPMLNQGESAVLFCFVFLFLALAGSGAWAIDATRRPAAR